LQAALPSRAAPQPDTGATIAALAVSLVGAPYHFGGADAEGFDCSGLALYVYERVGLAIPRTAKEQQRAASTTSASTPAPLPRASGECGPLPGQLSCGRNTAVRHKLRTLQKRTIFQPFR
jgi:cell wall-associated NlpC family hydrolase